MDSIVLTTANAGTSENHKLRLELSSDLRLKDSLVSLSHLSLYYTWNNFSDRYGKTEVFLYSYSFRNKRSSKYASWKLFSERY